MKTPELQAGSEPDVAPDNAARGRARQATQDAERRVQIARVQAQQAQQASQAARPFSGPEPEVEGAVPVEAVIGAGAVSVLGGLMDLLLDGDDERADETIIGSGDRAHHLALKSALVVYPPLPLRPARTLLPPLRPASRAACQRRCGKAGFCDPSSELGCGGEYCGNHHEPL